MRQESRKHNANGPRGNVKTRTLCAVCKGCGTLKFKIKFKSKTKTKSKTNQPQDELPEWYHPGGREVNCGKYGCKRLGHPPVLLFVLWFRHDEAEQQRKREAAKTYIKTNQIELVDPRVSFSSYNGRPERLSGRIRNNSTYALESVEVRLIFQDCSPQNKCETVGDEKTQINVNVPSGQSRDFDEYLSGPAVSPKGKITWSYETLSVSAHVN